MSEHSTIADGLKEERVALYCRVSSREQTVENQLLPLRDYAKARGWNVVEVYSDEGVSGSKDSRPALNKLMDAARKRQIDRVLVARFDRFGRSVKHLVLALDEFRTLGVQFTSLADNVDTGTPMGRMAFAMISAFAEFERAVLIDRVHAGLRRARAQGKRLGRPKVRIDTERVQALRQQGLSLRQIAREMAISKDAAARALSQKGG
jgi:DNA invertase Pin-like site-specific DNA recombinase